MISNIAYSKKTVKGVYEVTKEHRTITKNELESLFDYYTVVDLFDGKVPSNLTLAKIRKQIKKKNKEARRGW